MTCKKLTALILSLASLAISAIPSNAELSLSGDLAFGNVTVGSTEQKTLSIANTGEETVNVSGITFPTAFSGDWTSGAIEAGQTQSVTVTFAPVAAIAYDGLVVVESDSTPPTNNIAISGTGVGGSSSGPANDAFSAAIPIVGMEASVSGSNVGATKETGEPDHAGNEGGASVWWSWTAPESGPISVSTAGSDFDTTLGIYTGNSVSSLALVAANDDGPASPASQANFNAIEGTTYFIAVDGYNADSGSIQLSVGPIPPVFNPINATYNGLFHPAGDVTHDNSGFFTAKTTTKGKFSAKLTQGGKRYSFSGNFASDGSWTGLVNRKGAGPLTVTLQADMQEGDVLTGEVSDGSWTANLIADKAPFSKANPAPQAGRYTLVLPGSDDSSSAPGGHSVGTVNISPTGIAKFAGVLGDGTKVSQSVSLSAAGDWPLHAALYKGAGSIIGWLSVDPDSINSISGLVDWFKQPGVTSKTYPSGFVHQAETIGSTYQFIKGVPVLDLDEGVLSLENGGLSGPIIHDVMIDSKNKVVNLTDSKSSLKITTGSGLFKGKVTNPDTGKSVPVTGVVLQNQNQGAGHFVNGAETGAVYLGP